ncbi:hypothetical protein [Rosettibacter firmus]|uniref:hypothetical protein n=1 Tax=Rosettibacter firmus TaxID=3111522 RepID=UPI00336BE683
MRAFKLFTNINPLYIKCPECKSALTLHSSHSRNMKEQIIKRLTFFKIYRCKECGWRGYLSTYRFTKDSLKVLLLYGLIVLLSAYIIRYLIMRFVP